MVTERMSDAVDADLPGSQLVEPRNQIDQCGFAGAAGAYQRDDFSAAGFQADVLQNRPGSANRRSTHRRR